MEKADSLAVAIGEAEKAVALMAAHFGEGKADFEQEKWFRLVAGFVEDFERAVADNEHQAELARKQAALAARREVEVAARAARRRQRQGDGVGGGGGDGGVQMAREGGGGGQPAGQHGHHQRRQHQLQRAPPKGQPPPGVPPPGAFLAAQSAPVLGLVDNLQGKIMDGDLLRRRQMLNSSHEVGSRRVLLDDQRS